MQWASLSEGDQALNMDLNALSLKELKDLQSQVAKAISGYEDRRKREALAELTQEQQDVLALRFGYGMPIKDVAETVNKSEGSVKMLQVRAIAALTKRLAGKEVSDR